MSEGQIEYVHETNGSDVEDTRKSLSRFAIKQPAFTIVIRDTRSRFLANGPGEEIVDLVPGTIVEQQLKYTI